MSTRKFRTAVFAAAALQVFFEAKSVAGPTAVSGQTLTEITKRVAQRDPESKAILYVHPREDCPVSYDLNFSISRDGEDAVIKLFSSNMTGDTVFEQYRLKMDDSLRQQIENAVNYKKLEPTREARA